MNKININEQVNVTALGFRKNLATYPRRMEFQGVTYHFVDAGLRCLSKFGNYVAEFITATDGKSDFVLRCDNRGSGWTLISISS